MERVAKSVMEEMRVSIRQSEASPSIVRFLRRGKNSDLSLTLVVDVSRSLCKILSLSFTLSVVPVVQGESKGGEVDTPESDLF